MLPTASPGIFSAIMIGFGRAVGETMIVLMATGNTPVMDWSIFNGFRALSANIAVELPEAPEGGTLFRVLFLAAFLLFCLTFVAQHRGRAGAAQVRPRRGPIPGGADVPALTDLSIRVNVGEIFGFLGPNGAGKSTTIRLLLGFLHPTAGRARVLGPRQSSATASRSARRVGYLPGRHRALRLDDRRATCSTTSAALYGRPPLRRAELLDRLELSRADPARPVRDYSRGMRQKIGIIQALQHDPELAILDEPTEGLDPLMQRAFYDLLDDLRAAGRTIFFSSHVLSEVERVCDRVAIVRQGRLVALEDVAGAARPPEAQRRDAARRAGAASTASPGVTAVSRPDDGL